MRRTKIVGTMGPATMQPGVLDQLIDAGLDVARLNFSHGDHAFHTRTAEAVRAAAKRAGRPIAILMDLQGPKIRVGALPDGAIELRAGDTVIIGCGAGPHADGAIPCDYPGLSDDVKPGDPLLLDDGKLKLDAVAVRPGAVEARVVEGGLLKQRKGINLPGSHVGLPSLTEKDKRDLAFGVSELKVDYVALSFVRRAADVEEVMALAPGVPVIAKIEKPQAVADLENIVQASAGCMVARGDLGVEYPLRRVPLIQKEICELVNKHGKLVIVATQMLESMIESPVPTRAEVSDVANAVLDGADAVMLSAETASGKHPVEAVRTMAEILLEVESSARYRAIAEPVLSKDTSTVTTAVAKAAAAAARQLNLRTIVVYTRSGELARLVSEFRPPATIVSYTPRADVHTRTAALWGVRPRLVEEAFRTTDFMVAFMVRDLVENGLAAKGETVAIVSATPPDRIGHGASMMQVIQL